MKELKPCPFCGGEAKLNTDTPKGVHTSLVKPRVECTKCGAVLYGSCAVIVVEAWNSRIHDLSFKTWLETRYGIRGPEGSDEMGGD